MPTLPEPPKTPTGAIVQPQAVIEPASIDEAASRWTLVRRRLFHTRRAVVGLVLVLLLFSLAYVSPHFVAWQYDELDTSAFLSPPSAEHWFGTTQNGFDMFALTMRGMQKSLIIGLLGALIATSLAAVVGSIISKPPSRYAL